MNSPLNTTHYETKNPKTNMEHPLRHGRGGEIQLRDRPLLRASLQRIREQVHQVRLP